MSPKTLITSFALLSLSASAAVAAVEQPQSGLEQQVAEMPPQVIYPTQNEVVEDVISDIEDLQLTPDQFDRLKRIYLERERQKASPYVTPAKPITRTMFVSLDPGVSPPALRLTRGQQTSIVFSDVSGQPWFIENVSMNRQIFSDGQVGSPQKPTNILTVEPLTPAAYGNVTVTLRGLPTPVIFVLTSAQLEMDMRVDAKVPGRNPDAIDTITVSALPAIDDSLSNFLDGVPPKDAQRLNVTGLDGAEAWLYHDNLYVRAKANAQYPAYLSAARSTSGVSVYRYATAHNSVTFTTGGQAVTVFIE